MAHREALVRRKHFPDAEKHDLELSWVGGLDVLLKARTLMEEMEKELPPCPFCGASAALEGNFAFNLPAVRTSCTQCRSTTALQIAGQSYLTHRTTTLDECITSAVQLWKKRAS